MNTSEVLNRAADLIEERGWGQGPEGWLDIGHRGGPLCLEGGIMAALGRTVSDFDYQCPAYKAVADYLGLTPWPARTPMRDALWMWNDDDHRDAEEVIATLRAAAVIEAAKESVDVREPVPS